MEDTLWSVTEQIMQGAEPVISFGDLTGVLLLHDLGGSPNELQGLAVTFSSAGFSVDAPLLPGHGTSIDELEEMTWSDWAGAAQLGLDELASRCGSVVVVGLGLGATLGCFAGAQHPLVAGVIAINPRVMPVPESAIQMLEAMLSDGAVVVQPLRPDVSDQTAHVVGYETLPIRTLVSLFKSLEEIAPYWGEVDCPTLIATSAKDHRVLPENGDWFAERLGGEVERITLENSFHLATIDVDKRELEEAALAFANRTSVRLSSKRGPQ